MRGFSAGALDRRVTVQARTDLQDAAGQPLESWSDVVTVWAGRRLLSGLEVIKGGADVSTVQASYRLRYRAGLNAGMRLIDGSESWDIQAVLDKREDGAVDLVCRRLQ